MLTVYGLATPWQRCLRKSAMLDGEAGTTIGDGQFVVLSAARAASRLASRASRPERRCPARTVTAGPRSSWDPRMQPPAEDQLNASAENPPVSAARPPGHPGLPCPC